MAHRCKPAKVEKKVPLRSGSSNRGGGGLPLPYAAGSVHSSASTHALCATGPCVRHLLADGHTVHLLLGPAWRVAGLGRQVELEEDPALLQFAGRVQPVRAVGGRWVFEVAGPARVAALTPGR